MKKAVRKDVRDRAHNRCEYCQLSQEYSPVAKLQMEHVRPRKHGGSDDVSNLALACIDCNLRKGSNLSGVDPVTGEIVELFDPRTQQWSSHFERSGARIVGLTDIGRATVDTLDLNSNDRLVVRFAIGES